MAHGANAPLTVAVFDFQSNEDGLRDLGPKVSALVTADLSADERLITVERVELDKALSEQELGLSGTVSQETAAKVGQLTGAKVLVTGRVMKADRDRHVSRAVDLSEHIAAKSALQEAARMLAERIVTKAAQLSPAIRVEG